MYNRTIFEQGFDLHPLFFQQDGDTDVTGDWINMRDYSRAYILLHKGGTEDVDTGSVQVLQATDNAAGSAKGVTVRRCWFKQGTMTSQGTWTATTVGSGTPDDILSFGSAAGTGGTVINVTDVNTSAFLLLIEVLAEDMDVANGFDHITAFVEGDETNNACLYTAYAILANGSHKQAVPLSPL
jgi:hypothetical protein